MSDDLTKRETELKRLVAESGMDYPTQVLLNAKIEKMFECERSVQRGERISLAICVVALIVALIIWALT